MTPREQAYDNYYNVGYTQWGTIAKHGKVKSIGHPKSFSRAYDSKLAAGGAWGSQAYHFTNMKPNMRGAKALKFIAEHPGCTRREILDGIGLPPNYFSNFFTALKKTDLLDTTMSEKNSYTLTRKGMALVDDIFNSPLHESLLNEANMTITQIKALKRTLSELGDEAHEEELFIAEMYDEAEIFCNVVLMYLRDKSESNKKKVLLFCDSDDMSDDPETDGLNPLPIVKDEIDLPQFNEFADYVLNTLVPKLKGRPKKNFETPEKMVKYCVSRAAKLEGLTFSIEYIESDKSWAVLLDTTDEYEAENFREKVDEQLSINGGFSSGEYSYDDVQGLGDIHLGVLQYYEWSEDEYDDLDEEVRDKYLVYCEPAKNYKMRREMDW